MTTSEVVYHTIDSWQRTFAEATHLLIDVNLTRLLLRGICDEERHIGMLQKSAPSKRNLRKVVACYPECTWSFCRRLGNDCPKKVATRLHKSHLQIFIKYLYPKP